MLCFSTGDAWGSVEITATDGTTTAIFSPSVAVDNAVLLASELSAFLVSNFGVSVSVEYFRKDYGVALKFSTSAALTLSCNSRAVLYVGLSASSTGSTFTGVSPAAGTWGPSALVLGGFLPSFEFSGESSGTGAVGQALGANKPSLEAIAKPEAAARFSNLETLAKNPRRARILKGGVWRLVSVGAVSRERTSPNLYRYSIEVAG